MLPKGVPTSLAAVVAAFEPCFSKPTHGRFVVLVLGWLQCRSRRWITRVILAACGRSMGHHAAYYRFFSEASWHPTDVWRTLFLRLLRHVDGVLELIIDDTLCQRSGPRIFGISMHYDGASSAYRPSGHRGARTACGHSWVVLALRVPTPWPGPGIAVPIHARLYRSPKRCPESEYRTRTELGAEMLEDVLRWLPNGRRLHLLGDREYACRTLLRELDERIDFTGPMPLDAALYASHDGTPQVGRGRKRLKGARLSSPQVTVTKRPSSWKTQRVQMYGRAVRLQMQSWTCLWYTATGLRLIRVVVTREQAGARHGRGTERLESWPQSRGSARAWPEPARRARATDGRADGAVRTHRPRDLGRLVPRAKPMAEGRRHAATEVPVVHVEGLAKIRRHARGRASRGPRRSNCGDTGFLAAPRNIAEVGVRACSRGVRTAKPEPRLGFRTFS